MNDHDLFQCLKLNLIRDEGLRLKPYKDSVGKVTIGVGRNLDDRGISNDEAMLMLENDMSWAITGVIMNVPDVEQKPYQVRLALYNMCFNLGLARFLQFSKMLKAIDNDDFELAAEEALNSKWATQVGPRATRIADLLRQAAHE